jgi:hypothetical protein
VASKTWYKLSTQQKLQGRDIKGKAKVLTYNVRLEFKSLAGNVLK